MLAGKSTASSDDVMGYGTGFVVGLGAGSLVMGMVAAFAFSKRKSAAIENGAFERLL